MAIPICHLRFSELIGGVETHIVSLLAALDRTEFDPHVVTFPNPELEGRLREIGVPVTTMQRSGKRDVKFFLALRRHFKKTGVRIVHTHGLWSDFYTAQACRFWPGRPRHVLTKHTYPEADATVTPERKRRLDRMDNRLIFPRVHRFIAISEERARQLTGRSRIESARVRIIPNGVPVDEDRPPPPLDPSLRRELGVPEGTLLAGQIGRLVPEKGPDNFVEIIAAARERDLPVAGALVGDGPERENLETLARERGVADRVHFLGYRSDVPRLLPCFDAVVMASRTEGLPMLALEAMAAGRPMVASDVGGLPEVIERGVSGWLCAEGDHAAFAETLARIADRPEAARLVASRGRDRVIERFSAKAMAAEMTALYRELQPGG